MGPSGLRQVARRPVSRGSTCAILFTSSALTAIKLQSPAFSELEPPPACVIPEAELKPQASFRRGAHKPP